MTRKWKILNECVFDKSIKSSRATVSTEVAVEAMKRYASIKCKELEQLDSLKKELHEAKEECDRLSVFIRNNSYQLT